MQTDKNLSVAKLVNPDGEEFGGLSALAARAMENSILLSQLLR